MKFAFAAITLRGCRPLTQRTRAVLRAPQTCQGLPNSSIEASIPSAVESSGSGPALPTALLCVCSRSYDPPDPSALADIPGCNPRTPSSSSMCPSRPPRSSNFRWAVLRSSPPTAAASRPGDCERYTRHYRTKCYSGGWIDEAPRTSASGPR